MATIKDIANRLHISAGTVSKGLNGAPDISEGLRQQILDTAVELGYTRRGFEKIEKRKLCIFIENMDYYMDDDFGFDIILGFKQAAFKENWAVEVIPVSHGFQEKHPYNTFMVSQGFSGAFICGFTLDDPWIKEIQTTKMPTILLDNYIEHNPATGSVGTDSFEGIELAISHLVSLGHEAIAFLNGDARSMISTYRQHAYEQSLRAHHLPHIPELSTYTSYTSEVEPCIIKQFLDNDASAILCSSDLLAYSTIRICRELGLDVPQNISIIGYDDLPTSSIFDPPLSTIHQDRLLLGKSSYYILYALINGVCLSRNLLRPKLIVRSSTAVWR